MSVGFVALGNAIPSQDVVVFRCPTCDHVEADKANLKWRIQLGSPTVLCCGMCKGWIEVLAEVQIKAEANVSFVIPASSPLEVPALPSTEFLVPIADDPSHVKDEDAIDEQMSDGPADVPISEPGAQADQHLDSHPSVAPLLATKFSGNFVPLSIPELRKHLELRGRSTDPQD